MQTETTLTTLDLTQHWVGYISLAIFALGYVFVMVEEFTHLRKSKPVILAGGIIWALVAWTYVQSGDKQTANVAVLHTLQEYVQLFLFLLVAMTYVNAMKERQVFEVLRAWLVRRGWNLRTLFWMTGVIAFFISPLVDNLTTALIMCAVVIAVGAGNQRFINLACINIVVAANAGGAFSPFGDITTLMVWQRGIVNFWTFFALFVPSFVNWFVPAMLMHFFVPQDRPIPRLENAVMRRGARRVMVAFLATIITAVCYHNFLHLPPVVGMLTGLSYLYFVGYYLKKTGEKTVLPVACSLHARGDCSHKGDPEIGDVMPWDAFRKIALAEWDTLMFFGGVMLCVGGLSLIGYLDTLSTWSYDGFGHTVANVGVGVLSAIVDNIPVMFAVLNMGVDMSQGQWLLVTLTAGVGGSLLSIGSAAGVALMGQARGMYTFFGHLKWTPAIALGYVASIMTHLWLNAHMF